MPPLKAIEQAEFGGVDSRSNPIVMPAKRFLRCRNWVPRPDGHLDLREGYTLNIPSETSTRSRSRASVRSVPGVPVDPTQEMNHNVSASASYDAADIPANFSGVSYISTSATTSVDPLQMDDSMNPVTPAHVSRNSVHNLLPNYHGTWYAHLTPWFHAGGGGSHINNGTSSTDPTWVANALTDMWWRGFNGCIIDWYGFGDTTDSSTLLIQSYLAAHSLGTSFAIMIDRGCYSTTAQLENHLSYINGQYLSDPNYQKHGGVAVVLFFGTQAGVDYAAAKASIATPMFWIFEGPGAEANAYVDATFGWPTPYSSGVNPSDPYNLAADTSYLAAVTGTGHKPCIPALSPGFNGTLTHNVAWSQGKYLPRDHGKCWIAKCNNLNIQLPLGTMGIQVATWNDYEEGTQVETSIQNDIVVTASISGSTLTWAISGGTGDETTISGYRVIAQLGSSGGLIYTENPGGAKTLDLTTITGWDPATDYSIFIVAVGVGCVRDQVSSTLTYHTPSGGGGGGTGGGAAYSIYPYTVATPDTSANPAAQPPEPAPIFPNGRRCVVYWEKSLPSQALAAVTTAACSFDSGSPAGTPILATYHVDSAARFLVGHNATASGVVSGETTPAGFFNGTFPIASIGTHTITLQVGTVAGSGSHLAHSYSGTGGSILAADATPGPPRMVLFDLISRAIITTPVTIPIKGNPIASTARWHYALGKDGYLYMHNGTDAKFFDGVCLRDIGLPSLTPDQLATISVLEGFGAPPAGTGTDAASSGTPGSVSGAHLAWSGGGSFSPSWSNFFYYAFFDRSTDTIAPQHTPLGGDHAPTTGPSAAKMTITLLPTTPDTNVVGLVAGNINNQAGASFFTAHAGNSSKPLQFLGTMSGSGGDGGPVAVSCLSAHGMSVGDVVAIDFAPTTTPWPSNGPFTVQTVPDSTHFTFNAPSQVDAAEYTYSFDVTFCQLLAVNPSTAGTVTINEDDQLHYQGRSLSSTGEMQMPYFDDMALTLLPASAVGGDQPGYQFYASIYNPYTGHVGNRTPIGVRLNNTSDCTVDISGLPDFSIASLTANVRRQKVARYGYSANNVNWGTRAGEPQIPMPSTDPEWRILIGRTGDGGEVPYACIDSNGNWVTTLADNQTGITISSGEIDSNSELPFENFPPPAFATFWREGDRMCGTILNQPFVWRSGSELDATTGIFVGDPAQSWTASRVETFPSAQAVIGGFGHMQESWVFTRGEVGQLSELSGEVAWNGPYIFFGIAGPFAFDTGWNSLPFWVSHEKQLCTMMPGGNGPISISTEYETALLAKIGDEYDATGNYVGYLQKTEVVYFRDPERMIDVLRIKCLDKDGNPFTIIHDFHLRDDASPYGQAYEEDYMGVLSIDYEQAFIRDGQPYPRMWAAASDGAIYQFYTGGLDEADFNDPTVGEAFTADAINLRYLGGDRTAVRTLEWYGDAQIQWFITDKMLDVIPDPNYWENLSYEMRPFPGDTGNDHYMVDLQRPEMIHCYLWAQIVAHPLDTPTPLTPMELSDPPHIPVETYGRLYLAAPIVGDTRGR